MAAKLNNYSSDPEFFPALSQSRINTLYLTLVTHAFQLCFGFKRLQ